VAGVGTSIIGRPRPLPSDRRAHDHYTLICEEPQNPGRFSFKGYVTNLGMESTPGEEVITAYHDLWHVEQLFRMTKGDLAARPVYLHSEDKINAHLTTVMASLAVARDLQDRSGWTIRRILHTLEPLRSSRIRISGQTLEFPPEIPPTTQELLDKLNPEDNPPTGR
jgi:hypothetical protein